MNYVELIFAMVESKRLDQLEQAEELEEAEEEAEEDDEERGSG